MVAPRFFRFRRHAFTLVELLVVIAIIGVLVALLLPAVQQAREAARRMQCSNGLRQIGIGIHNFHDTKGYLPPGGAVDQQPHGNHPTGVAWGSSWLVYILPFIEQAALYDQLEFEGGSGWGASAAINAAAARGVFIETYLCPSTSLEREARSGYGGNNPMMAVSYVGISGAVDGLIPSYTEIRLNTPGSAADCCSGGIISGSGIIIPGGSMNLAKIKDGTTNTLMVGETSDFLITEDGAKRDYRSSAQHGWMIGWRSTQAPPNAGNGGDNRTFQMVTLRYPINQKVRPGTGWPNWPGNCGTDGICQNASSNTPLNSSHPGGCMGLMADASVQFLPENMELAVAARMTIRDDGQPVDF